MKQNWDGGKTVTHEEIQKKLSEEHEEKVNAIGRAVPRILDQESAEFKQRKKELNRILGTPGVKYIQDILSPVNYNEMHRKAYLGVLINADKLLSQYLGPCTPTRLELAKVIKEVEQRS